MLNRNSVIRAIKYHILGNSYILLPPDRNPELEFFLEERELHGIREPALRSDLVRRICSLDYGIGSSGVILGPLQRTDGKLALHIYNVDGSRCNFSGNAIRMLARYLVESGVYPDAAGTRFELGVVGHAGPVDEPCIIVSVAEVEVVTVGAEEVRAYLPSPQLHRHSVISAPQAVVSSPHPASAPTTADVWLTVPALAALGRTLRPSRAWDSSALVNVGNPHCVTFVKTPDDLPAEDFGDVGLKELIALSYVTSNSLKHPLAEVFPDGCNLQFVYAEPSGLVLHLRTFERGGGPTRSSGSSSSAAAAVAFARGLVGPEVKVSMIGGDIEVRLIGDPSHITGIGLSSAVTRVAAVEMDVGVKPS